MSENKKPNSIKKIIAIVAVCVFCAAAVALGALYSTGVLNSPATKQPVSVASEEHEHEHNDADAKEDLSKAVYSGKDALDFIKSFSASDLEIKGEISDYRLMVKNTGVQIDGKDYVKVIFVQSTDSNSFNDSDIVASFFISYDGKHLLKLNDDGTYRSVLK